jgi:hypothetical protein
MEWNAFGLLGYLLLGVILFGIICLVAFAVASLILRIIYRNKISSDENDDSKKKAALKLLMCILLILIFGFLLKQFLIHW